MTRSQRSKGRACNNLVKSLRYVVIAVAEPALITRIPQIDVCNRSVGLEAALRLADHGGGDHLPLRASSIVISYCCRILVYSYKHFNA